MTAAAHDGAYSPEPPSVVITKAPFQALVDDVARGAGTSRAAAQEEVLGCLEEMCVVPSATKTSQLVWRRLSRFMSRAYTVDVDTEGLDQLRELGRNASLVFLPNHKSYLDPVILRATLGRHGFPPNFVLGGDNLAFWPMAPLARRNGIVFIRREFKGADVYKRTLRTYLAYLLSRNANLEWYIEGGRSRTGKLRPPRYGILSYVVDAFMSAHDETAYLVPVSVTYDQQHEIGAISAEEAGASKSPESAKWLVQYARDQSRRLGAVHLRFGEPLSIGEAIETARQAERDKAAERGEAAPQDLERYVVPKMAFEVCYRINAVTPVTPTSLVTFALLDNDDRALTFGEGENVLGPVVDYIEERNLELTAPIDAEPGGAVDKSVERLIREGVVERFSGGQQDVYSISPDRMHEAGYYRNSIAHHFLVRAMVELALVKVAEDKATDVVAQTWNEVKDLADLLKYEFFFPTRAELAADVEREVSMVVPNWQHESWDSAQILHELRTTPMHVAHRTIGPFLEAYEVVALVLAEKDPAAPIDQKALLEESIGMAGQWWRQRQLHSPESISKNLFSGALQLAGNRNLLEPGAPDLARRRREFADELSAAVRRTQRIRRWANKLEGLNEE